MTNDSKIITWLVSTLLVIGILLMGALLFTRSMETNIFYDKTKHITYDVAYTQTGGTTDQTYILLYYNSDLIPSDIKKQINAWAELYNYYVPIYLVDLTKEENSTIAGNELVLDPEVTPDVNQIKIPKESLVAVHVEVIPPPTNEDGTTPEGATTTYDILSYAQGNEVPAFIDAIGVEVSKEAVEKEEASQ